MICIEMYLDSLQIKGQGGTGNLPLHRSLLNRQKGVHIPTLKYQIEKYPLSLKVVCTCGDLALHMAV